MVYSGKSTQKKKNNVILLLFFRKRNSAVTETLHNASSSCYLNILRLFTIPSIILISAIVSLRTKYEMWVRSFQKYSIKGVQRVVSSWPIRRVMVNIMYHIWRVLLQSLQRHDVGPKSYRNRRVWATHGHQKWYRWV